jgi:hypothetical protein
LVSSHKKEFGIRFILFCTSFHKVHNSTEIGDRNSRKKKKYGSKNLDGAWSGIIGRVASRHADLGLSLFDFSTEHMDIIDILNTIGTYR